MLAAGLACLVAFLPLELWIGNAPWHFSNLRDRRLDEAATAVLSGDMLSPL